MSHFQDLHDIVRELNAALGPTLVAALSGSKDRRLPIRWAKADGLEPRPEAARRLTFGHHQWRLLAAADGEHVARQWFIGGNPHLNENTPLTAIREDRDDEVANAVESFIAVTHARTTSPTRPVDQAEVESRMSFADAALGAAGHQVTDPALNDLARQTAGGTLTTEDAIARGLKHIDAR